MRSVRVGEVPAYNDRTSPKNYRRQVLDWICFQDLAADDSAKKLTLSQQVFSILTNIQVSAGQRLAQVSSIGH